MGRPRKKKPEETSKVEETVKPENPILDVASHSIPEEEGKAGKKIVASNEDGLNRPVSEDAPKKKAPSYFITPDAEILAEVDIVYRNDNGQIVHAALHEDSFQYNYSAIVDNPYLTHRLEWFKFAYPRYYQINIIRQECLKNDPRNRGKMTVDPIEFRQRCLLYFLKDWSLVDENGNKIALEMNSDGNMTDETIQKVQDFSPAIMDIVMTKFETEAGL